MNSSLYTKSNPGKVNLGHAGVGSSNFLICKAFRGMPPAST